MLLLIDRQKTPILSWESQPFHYQARSKAYCFKKEKKKKTKAPEAWHGVDISVKRRFMYSKESLVSALRKMVHNGKDDGGYGVRHSSSGQPREMSNIIRKGRR